MLGNGNDTRELPTKPLPRAGTILVREWKGTAHYVTVTDEGLRLAAALAAAYVVANYKETQLTDVRPGQSAAISVDMFPGITFNGHVDSISPASGQEFALLPPDNATGNFTKVVQRIPVKIVLDPGSKFAGELRPGMSVYPTIETKPRDLRTASASVRRG